MTVIWWTLYILGALSIVIIWINLMGLIGYLFKVIKNKEWAQVKIGLKQGDNWMAEQSPVDVDKLIKEYYEKKEDK